MKKYAILQNPGHNRVYFTSSLKLSLNELAFASKKFSSCIENVRGEIFGGVDYITFEKQEELTKSDIVILSRLSFTYALFEIENSRFIPIEKNLSYFFSDDLNMILKYSGKTNEIFTRMMINLAVFTSEFDYGESINLLDPLCGKGTTLFEGLICGYNTFGVELSEKSVDESAAFLKKYLETKKYKHIYKKEKAGGQDSDGKKFRAKKHNFELSKNKDDKKDNKQLTCEIINGDTKNTDKLYKKNFFHILVADLPYGIQHENTAKGNSMRNSTDLLEASVPAWANTLKTGGAIVLSWNTFQLKRENIIKILGNNNIYVSDDESANGFEHRVDQAINRDIIIGVKAGKSRF